MRRQGRQVSMRVARGSASWLDREAWRAAVYGVAKSRRPHGLQPSRLLYPWDFPGKSTGVGCHRDPEAAHHSSPAGIPSSPLSRSYRAPPSDVPRGLSVPGLPSVPLQPCPAINRAGALVQRELTGHPEGQGPPRGSLQARSLQLIHPLEVSPDPQ